LIHTGSAAELMKSQPTKLSMVKRAILHFIKNNRGFTILETIIILLVIGILIAAAAPKFIAVRRQALQATTLYTITKHEYPEKLDYAAVNEPPSVSPYFEVVIENPIVNNVWSKVSDINTYKAPNDSIYVYDPEEGIIK